MGEYIKKGRPGFVSQTSWSNSFHRNPSPVFAAKVPPPQENVSRFHVVREILPAPWFLSWFQTDGLRVVTAYRAEPCERDMMCIFVQKESLDRGHTAICTAHVSRLHRNMSRCLVLNSGSTAGFRTCRISWIRFNGSPQWMALGYSRALMNRYRLPQWNWNLGIFHLARVNAFFLHVEPSHMPCRSLIWNFDDCRRRKFFDPVSLRHPMFGSWFFICRCAELLLVIAHYVASNAQNSTSKPPKWRAIEALNKNLRGWWVSWIFEQSRECY